MELYNSLKPLLQGVAVVIAGWRALNHYTKNESKEMWMAIGVGALVYYFLGGPATTLQAFNGLLNAVMNFLKGMGG
ncbi:TcpD family membrane protein [Leuconostoc citreum]|uniref:TcpD family membrane protein n=1 Tax=Leuconostoc citreum TaxID=33964 RepID=UPI0032DF84C8